VTQLFALASAVGYTICYCVVFVNLLFCISI